MACQPLASSFTSAAGLSVRGGFSADASGSRKRGRFSVWKIVASPVPSESQRSFPRGRLSFYLYFAPNLILIPGQFLRRLFKLPSFLHYFT